MNHIVAFGRIAYSGKDTCGNFLGAIAEQKGDKWRRFAFADALKEEVANALGVTVEEINDPENKPHYRRLLQEWGGIRRWQDVDYWVKVVERNIFTFQSSYDLPDRDTWSIITDVRHKNEVAFVRAKGGIYVEVVREGYEPVNDHLSEHDLADVVPDVRVLNNDTLRKLMQKMVLLYQREKQEPDALRGNLVTF